MLTRTNSQRDGYAAGLWRVVDRWFALGLTFYPVVLAARAAGVGERAAVWVAVGLVTVAAVALVAVGPRHASGDAWWFGLYTAVAFWAVVVAAERWFGYPATDRLPWILGVWLVSLAAAVVGVSRRRANRGGAA